MQQISVICSIILFWWIVNLIKWESKNNYSKLKLLKPLTYFKSYTKYVRDILLILTKRLFVTQIIYYQKIWINTVE